MPLNWDVILVEQEAKATDRSAVDEVLAADLRTDLGPEKINLNHEKSLEILVFISDLSLKPWQKSQSFALRYGSSLGSPCVRAAELIQRETDLLQKLEEMNSLDIISLYDFILLKGLTPGIRHEGIRG